MIFLASMSIFNFCHRFVPCLADPARRTSLGLKAALVVLHIVYAGILFLFDSDLIEKTKQEPWSYTALYLLLCVATLIQYFVTSCSSPGNVLDAMRDVNEKNSLFSKASMLSNDYSIVIMFKQRQPASSKNGSLIITVEGSQSERNIPGSNVTSWTKLVLDMHPPGTSISLHEQSIAMIVIDVFFSLTIIVFGLGYALAGEIIVDFGEHFILLKYSTQNCVGWIVNKMDLASNSIRVAILHHKLKLQLWYIFEETALCIWTGILYITYLKANISRAWLKDVIMILLLVTLSIALIFLLLLLIFHSHKSNKNTLYVVSGVSSELTQLSLCHISSFSNALSDDIILMGGKVLAENYLILTNQTTYELIRRRRIPYLRAIPERVYPFSKGVCRNLYNFCCARSSIYSLERLPTAMELEDKSRPYTCLEFLTCRCC
ncbi:hypothetical protein DKX38_007632 [Salix brachista]|uniref:S-acyltransferase n=1 Tax=Salix brachista TaxID=2182728 RepID=A0A5N5MQM1_9ROSI|nr:hypothetical protein DKX38_007632 [Salix brachista]